MIEIFKINKIKSLLLLFFISSDEMRWDIKCNNKRQEKKGSFQQDVTSYNKPLEMQTDWLLSLKGFKTLILFKCFKSVIQANRLRTNKH